MDLPNEMARCTSCKEWLDLSNFGRRSSDAFGFSPRCKSCVNRIHGNYKARRTGLLTLADREDPIVEYVPERWGPPPTEDLSEEELSRLTDTV